MGRGRRSSIGSSMKHTAHVFSLTSPSSGTAAAEEEEKKNAAKKTAEKVDLKMPTQKEVKSALLKLKECANPDFKKKWKLDSLSGNKLAKMKFSEFTKIWEDFAENCSDGEHREF